ncbi:MAG: PAS domain-containing protein [Roseovarius sp.]
MFLQIVQNISLLLIAVIATYPLANWLRNAGSALSQPIAMGLVLGCAAFLVSSFPITLPDGSLVDGRAGPMLFAGFMGGPVAGVIAAAIGCIARILQGGPFALAGAFGFFIYAFAGTVLGIYLRRAGKPLHITPINTALLILLSGVGLANTYWFIYPVELANAWFAGAMVNVFMANAASTVVMALAAHFLTEATENRRRVQLLDERLDIATRHTGLGIWEFDPQSFTLTGNAQYARIFGLDRVEEPIGFADWLRNLAPEDRAPEAHAFETALRERRQFDREYRLLTPRGERRTVKSYGTILRDPGGTAQRVVGLVFDITGLRESERMQQQAEMRLADVARTLPGALMRYRVTAKGQAVDLEYLNPACEEVFEISPETVREDPTTLWDIVHPDDRQEQHENVVASMERLAPTMTEFRVVTALGATKHLQARARPRALENGDVEFSVLILDITEQVHLKQALSESRRLLHEAQRMDALGKLTGGVAHDFNNLLTVIMGNLELIGLEARGEEREMFDDAVEACRRGARLTQQLLTFSRKAHLQPRTLDLGELLARTRRLLERTLPETIRIELQVAPGLHPVTLDPSLLENALLNLALNARDAMPNGGTLRIAAANSTGPAPGLPQASAGAPCVQITVSDTGEGMSAEVLRRAFEPFFTTKPPGEGSGMGLSMVHGFVSQSEGHVDVVSESGSGTRVSLTFPAARAATAPETSAAPPAAPQEDARHPALHVLLVEDEASVRRVIRRLLEAMGCRVSEAADGATGLRAAETDPGIDVVLSDIVMPGPVQGTQLARTLRRSRPGLPVILMTGYARDVTADAETGEQELLAVFKPVRRAELERALRAAMTPSLPIPANRPAALPRNGKRPAG